MRRKFENPSMQHVYDTLYDDRPERTEEENSIAFFIGYENPQTAPTASCGKEQSDIRAAWWAGVDSRRDDDKLDREQFNGKPVHLVF